MAIFKFFKITAVRYFEFLEIQIFNSRYTSQGKYASQYEISRISVKLLRRYGHFRLFEDGSRTPS